MRNRNFFPPAQRANTYGPGGNRFINALQHRKLLKVNVPINFWDESATSGSTNLKQANQLTSAESLWVHQIAVRISYVGEASADTPTQTEVAVLQKALSTAVLTNSVDGLEDLGVFPLSLMMNFINTTEDRTSTTGFATGAGENNVASISLPTPIELAPSTNIEATIEMNGDSAVLDDKWRIELIYITTKERQS